MFKSKMSFSVYWESKKVSDEVFAKFVEMVPSLLRPTVEVEVTEAALAFNPPEDRGETFYVNKNDSGFHSCKTYAQPYTTDVLRCLCLMVDLGMAYDVRADDDMGYLKELSYVHGQYPLKSYQQQKEYFKSIISMC